MLKKTTQFKQLLQSNQLEFLLEAHDGLSAKIVEESGHKGIWGSGLGISAALGVRDNNEASWTQVLEVVEFMSDATTIPLLLDADTGYGNFNNVCRLVRKLEQRQVAAVCLEDKLFPKTNSFIGEQQPLADMDEFCGKIKAAKDTQHDADFCVVARIEAFIAGRGLNEALKRAYSYSQAGADAILVHSKWSNPDQILEFMKAWQAPCPVVIVPTMYFATPTSVFEEANVSMVIWANHLVRASIAAMQRVANTICHERSLMTVEDTIVPVREIFRLQDAATLKQAEAEYLPSRPAECGRAIVLAASKGADLGSLTDEKPKAMLHVQGKPLLQRLADHFHAVDIHDIIVVGGYKAEAITLPDVTVVVNAEYAQTKELYSLSMALDYVDRDVVISYGDILFKNYILLRLLNEPGDIVVNVDSNLSRIHVAHRFTDFVRCSRRYDADYFEEPVQLLEMSPSLLPDRADGEWIGLVKLSAEGGKHVHAGLEVLRSRKDFAALRMNDLFEWLLQQGHEIRVVYSNGHWLDIDDLEILSEAMKF
ncbi:MAG: phosphoenolpyruvate mutase [Nitrospirales bacterium]|nr:phosphoenolpyruvate mutase [Nitrospirales bacterium]